MADNEKDSELEETDTEADIETEELDGEDLVDLDNEVVELEDEDGNIFKFKFLDVTEYKGEKYVLMLPAEPNDEIAEDEVVIFRYTPETEAPLEIIEDEQLLQEIYDFYNDELDELD